MNTLLLFYRLLHAQKRLIGYFGTFKLLCVISDMTYSSSNKKKHLPKENAMKQLHLIGMKFLHALQIEWFLPCPPVALNTWFPVWAMPSCLLTRLEPHPRIIVLCFLNTKARAIGT